MKAPWAQRKTVSYLNFEAMPEHNENKRNHQDHRGGF